MKSSLAVTRRSWIFPFMVADFSKRDFAIWIFWASVVGMMFSCDFWVRRGSWYAVRKTRSVDRARWFTQWACEESVLISVPVVASQSFIVLSWEEV